MTRQNISCHRLACQLRRDHYRRARKEKGFQSILNGILGDPSPAGISDNGSEIKQLKDQLIRKQAESENFRKRSRREQQQKIQMANLDLVESMLPVVDNFHRATQNPGDSVEGLLSGIEMVFRQLLNLLEQNGLEQVEALGQVFDPNLHEAVSTGPSKEYEDNHVCEVFQDGYRLKDRLVRPAMVRVVKN
jgi:molecular chaperone GrpE